MAREGNLIRRKAVISLQHCVTRYRLESPDGLELCGILRTYILPEGCCDGQDLRRTFTQPEQICPCKRGIVWYDDLEKVLHVKHNLTHGDLLIELSVMPSTDSCELPETLYSDWLDVLLMGTRAYIMLIPGRPWTNVQLGRAYMQEFEARIKKAAVETATHKMRGGIVMRFGRVL